ncbi:MAG: SBBP repeat-containing protein [Gemmatimonadetes bacterium]|nr:SBBP repeat-containing protein [Gemmatimonadota bacterium]
MTYLGGNDGDMPRDVTVDASGNVVVVGSAASTNFPVTAGADRPDSRFRIQSALRRLHLHVHPAARCSGPPTSAAPATSAPTRSRPTRRASCTWADGRGPLPVTAGAFPDDRRRQHLQFLVRRTPSSPSCCLTARRVSGAAFGVGDDGIARDLAIDTQGNVYVVAWTNTGGFRQPGSPTRTSAPRRPGSGVVVAKIKADGSQVLWATYLGGVLATTVVRPPFASTRAATSSSCSPPRPPASPRLTVPTPPWAARATSSSPSRALAARRCCPGRISAAMDSRRRKRTARGRPAGGTQSSSSPPARPPRHPGAYQSQSRRRPSTSSGRCRRPGSSAVSYYGGAASDAIQGRIHRRAGELLLGHHRVGQHSTPVPRGVGGGRGCGGGEALRRRDAPRCSHNALGGSGDDVRAPRGSDR